MKFQHRIAAAAVSFVLAAAMMTGCGAAKIDGTKTVLTVNDQKVPLGVASFLTKYEQAQIYTMYSQYFGTAGMFDTVEDSSAGTTYGDSVKDGVIKDLEELVLVNQHASDYSVTLTDDEKTSIDKAAQAYIDKNDQAVRDKIGASKDDVVSLLTMETIKSKMLEPMAKDVDTNVTQEESQQTSVSYVTFTLATDDSSAATTSTSSTDTRTTAEKNADLLANANKVLAAMQASSDVGAADMDATAKKIDSELIATTGHYTTSNPTDTYLDSAIVDAVKDMKTDGTMVDKVITSSDGTKYFVVRLDKVNDADQTKTKSESIIKQRKQDNYDSMVAKWKEAAKITVDDAVWGSVTVTDSDPIMVATESTAASTAASAAASTAASGAASTAASGAASTAASAAAGTDSTASAADSTASAAS